jgi:AcrR family transcriptional regulator
LVCLLRAVLAGLGRTTPTRRDGRATALRARSQLDLAACVKTIVKIGLMPRAERVWRGPRGPYAGTAARKEEILRAALEVFGSRGFRNGSLREIAERVGLTQAGLIHHFGSKIGLFMEVLHSHAADVREVQTRLPFQEEVLAVVDDSESNRDYIRLFTTISSEATDPNHPAHEYWIARYREAQERWRKSIETEQKSGSIDPAVDADAAARLVIAALDGLNIQWLLGTTTEMRGAIEYLLTALFPPRQPASRAKPDANGKATSQRPAGGAKAKA